MRRSQVFCQVGVTVLVLAACGSGPDDLCAETPEVWNFETDFDPAAHLLRCERVPELCDRPVRSTVAEPDLSRAVDLVFVSDGYRADELSGFHERAGQLRAALLADPRGIVGRDPTLFNFHEVEVASESNAVAHRALRTCTSSVDSATSLGDMFRVVRAAANAPDSDMTIAIVNRKRGWREAVTGPPFGAPFIVTDLETSPETLTHEMGHILVGLADEYVEFQTASPDAQTTKSTTARKAPNLSLSKDETWDGLVSGALEGGGLHAKGIYRPTDRCVMNDQYVHDFCPVCSHAIDEVLAGRRGTPDGAPRCGLWLRADRSITAFGRDANGLTSLKMTLDGAPLGGDVITPDPLMKRPPLYREIGASLMPGQMFEVTCADATGASARASLTAD